MTQPPGGVEGPLGTPPIPPDELAQKGASLEMAWHRLMTRYSVHNPAALKRANTAIRARSNIMARR